MRQAAYVLHLSFNFKCFSIMTRKEKSEMREQFAVILSNLLDSHQLSEEFSQLQPIDKFFEDACKMVDLRYELHKLVQTLEYLNKYSAMLEK